MTQYFLILFLFYYKYYSLIQNLGFQNIYSIVYYDGRFSTGYLYVTSDYIDLSKTPKMTYVPRDSKTSLPITNSENKYFYITNSDYNKYSNYLYFYLEDTNSGLSYNNIKYCHTNTNPNSNPDDAIEDCSFNSVSYYELTGSKKY